MKHSKIFDFCYSIGAAAVIIGAMGKIMHYYWSDTVLQISLILEAAIFVMIGVQSLLVKDVPSPTGASISDGSDLAKSVNNLNETIKQVFNR